MSHPLKQFSNLILEVREPTGRFEEDPVTGNLDEIFKIYEMKATVKLVERSLRDVGYEINPNRIYIKGYLIEPKSLPEYLVSGSKLKATLVDVHSKNRVKGEFAFDLLVQSRIKQVSKLLGSQIKGWFQSV
jgi:hypothetical protein